MEATQVVIATNVSLLSYKVSVFDSELPELLSQTHLSLWRPGVGVGAVGRAASGAQAHPQGFRCSDLLQEEAFELVGLAAGVLVRRRGHGLHGLLVAFRIREGHHVIEVVAARATRADVRARLERARACERARASVRESVRGASAHKM